MSYKKEYFRIIDRLFAKIKDYYKDRLVSVAVFGSLARGTFRPDSDIDVLIVAEGLPRGRRTRVEEFIEGIEEPLDEELSEEGIRFPPELSPVIKTPEEVRKGSPLFLDMTEEVIILYDQEDFLKKYLEGFREKLKRLGARRVRRGGGWYWILKPDYQPGEIIEL